MSSFTIDPCTRCGASMPPATLDQVHVRCAYCGHVAVAPPPPPHAWLAQHHEMVRAPTQLAAKINLFNSGAVALYVIFVGSIIGIGLLKLLFEAIWLVAAALTRQRAVSAG
jgi:hypothetical protein